MHLSPTSKLGYLSFNTFLEAVGQKPSVHNVKTSSTEESDLFLEEALVWFNPLKCFFGSEGHVALDRNPVPGYDTLLLRMISGDLFKCISL